MKELSRLYRELVVMQFPTDKKHPDISYDNYYRQVKHAVNLLFKDFERNQEDAIEKWLGMEPTFTSKRLNNVREVAKHFPQFKPEHRPTAGSLREWYEWFLEVLGD